MIVPDWKIFSQPMWVDENTTEVSIRDDKSRTTLYARFNENVHTVKEWSDNKVIESVLKYSFETYFYEHASKLIDKELNERVEVVESLTESTSEEVSVINESIKATHSSLNTLSKQILKSDIPAEDYQELISIYPEWETDVWVYAGDITSYNGKAYEVVPHEHYTVVSQEPDVTPAVFNEITPAVIVDDETGEEAEIIPEWEKPPYAEVGYNTGDKVMFEGQIWESTTDKNTWSPTEYPDAWELVE